MGKLHKRFNWKGRQVVNTVIDQSEQNKIKVEIPESTSHYDASNALVLPSAKRKTKKLRDKNASPVKLLSRKQRKKLMKIAEKKLKNSKREELLKDLKKVQAKPKDLAILTSLQTIQTLGRKKYKNLSTILENGLNPSSNVTTEEDKNNLLKWKTPKSIKRELKLQSQASKPKRLKRDYSIVQTDSSSCSSSEDEDEKVNHKPNGDINTSSALGLPNSNRENTLDASEDLKIENKAKPINSDFNTTENSVIDKSDEEKTKIAKVKIKKSKKEKKKCSVEIVAEENKTEKNKMEKKKKKKKVLEENMDKEKEEKVNKIKKKKKKTNNDKKLKKKLKGKTLDIPEESTCTPSSNTTTTSNTTATTTTSTTTTTTNNNNNADKINSENKALPQTPKFKLVNRDIEIQKHRLKLPVLSEEHTIMEAINENPITIVVGPTGSGKTTQIPQFLYEAGFTCDGKKIGVTEPRRIAAISMAERVGYELNLPSSEVSYQIRYEGNTTADTKIKFMTDGVLFQEVKNNHYLTDYSAIVIDEVHERSVHTDILLGLLSRIVLKRNKRGNPLKLIIMSATPRIEDFTQNSNLFSEGIPPVIQVPSRLYNVTIHFNKKTDNDYCEAAFTKICKIHRLLPEGGILVFLTGQQEILELCKRLKQTFPLKENGIMKSGKKNKRECKEKQKNNQITIPEINLKDFINKSPVQKGRETEQEMDIPDEDIFDEEISKGFLVTNESPLWVLPLYSLLPSHKQKRVFEVPPEGTRLCVVATNVAETSLTIPNIKYVVDSGKTKEKLYDPITGISTFNITWTSKASATQRSGRAGRTSDGHCYRLYSSAVFNDEFSQYAIPDIQKRPLDDVVLTMKSLKIPVYNFPFPTRPDIEHLSESFKRLSVLKALEESEKLMKIKIAKGKKEIDTTVITNLGLDMATLPLAPRFAKMVINCLRHPEVFPYIVIIISALTVREIFLEIPINKKKTMHPIHEKWGEQRRKWGGSGKSHLLGDLLVLINAVLEAEKNNFSHEWCYENGFRHSALMEYRKLRRQLTNEINLLCPETNFSLTPDLKPPTDEQTRKLAEAVFTGSVDQVARRVDSSEFATQEEKKMWMKAYRTVYSDKPAFLSSSSVLYKDMPMYIMYQEIYETSKIYLRCATVVNEHWLLYHGGPLVNLSPPLDSPPPSFNPKLDRVMCHRKGTFGPRKWELRPYSVDFPSSPDLFKWVAYFFLIGELWTPLKHFVKYLYDPKTITSPITIMYREKRHNLIRAFINENVKSASDLEIAWKKNPIFLKSEYFAWFENEGILFHLNKIWPPIKESELMII